ncbi:alpha/beta fold hydrolase [Leptospira meyeri]|uniref:alpha/beta fold hydrolase n=1 Tax=Leptospira meyeri TaxID=29508 RepID=UPI001E4B6B7F|nr:alpha/beta hydrolase [Leptospira meyeri]
MSKLEKSSNIKEFDMIFDGQSIRIAMNENPIENRPHLVFLHDSLGCISLWKEFPKQLAKITNCNVMIYDRLGYGKSAPFVTETRSNSYLEKEADFLFRILSGLNLRKTILFGHSDGGSIALIAAAKYPESIRGVITEGAHVFVEDITLIGIREAKLAYETTKLKQVLEKYHGSKTENVFSAWVDTWLSGSFRDWNMEILLPSIQCPVLVIQGVNDEYGSENQVNTIVNLVSGKSIKRMIPNAKHTPHKENPELVLEDVSDFIKSEFS